MEVEGVWENWYTDEVIRSLWSGNIVIYDFSIFWNDFFEMIKTISMAWSLPSVISIFLYLSITSHDKVNFVFANLKYHDFHFSQPVEYLPWAPDRPYDGGVKYNCMLVKVFSRHKILYRNYYMNQKFSAERCLKNFPTVSWFSKQRNREHLEKWEAKITFLTSSWLVRMTHKMILGTSTIQPFLPQVVEEELTKAHQPNTSLHEGSQVRGS